MHVNLDAVGGSALTDRNIDVPESASPAGTIPATYVPARTPLFLSFSRGWPELFGARLLSSGVTPAANSVTPACRPASILLSRPWPPLPHRAASKGARFAFKRPSRPGKSE